MLNMAEEERFDLPFFFDPKFLAENVAHVAEPCPCEQNRHFSDLSLIPKISSTSQHERRHARLKISARELHAVREQRPLSSKTLRINTGPVPGFFSSRRTRCRIRFKMMCARVLRNLQIARRRLSRLNQTGHERT
jgi:hypothetical protein